MQGFLASFVLGFAALGHATPVPRNVHIEDQEFVRTDDGSAIVMSGPNVVVKASPYLPAVDGDTICNDVVRLVIVNSLPCFCVFAACLCATRWTFCSPPSLLSLLPSS